MAQICACLLIIIFLGAEFIIFGTGFRRLFRLRLAGHETAIAGFFAYFGLFQGAALPLILLGRPFHELKWLWLAVCVLVDALVLLKAGDSLAEWAAGAKDAFFRMMGPLLAAILLLLAFTCYFQWAQRYLGWDTSFYIGTVNTTLDTDTMYAFDGNTGKPARELPLRYALSSFYMHTAWLCALGRVTAAMAQKFVMGSVCVWMHGLLLFSMGRRLFPKKERDALVFTGIAMALHYGLNTLYSSSAFLLARAYEAKGFCANVVIPAMFYAALCLWQDAGRRESWALLFVAAFSSVPVSMSSLPIVPAMIGILALTESVLRKDRAILGKGALCMLPNAAYLLAYALFG